MKKSRAKRSISLMLALIMAMACLPFSPSMIKADAATSAKITQSEAVTWLKNQDGAKYDFDGRYGTQCVEFVKAYVNYLVTGSTTGMSWSTGNGCDIWKNSKWSELGWTVYSNTSDFVPQPGDIFSAGTSSANHTGVVISSTATTATIADANARNSDWSDGDPVWVHTITWKSASSDTAYGATHFIRPVFKSASTATYTISYNANGGTGAPAAGKKTQGVAYLVPSTIPTREGYTFVDWGRSKYNDDHYIKPGQYISYDGNQTLYANWRANQLIINYKTNGGIINSDSFQDIDGFVCSNDGSKKYNYGSYNNYINKDSGLYNASSFGLTRPGYEFVGWGTSPSGGTIFDEDDGNLKPTDITSDIKKGDCTVTLYAIWAPHNLVIKYNVNGGRLEGTKYYEVDGLVCSPGYGTDDDVVAPVYPQGEGKSIFDPLNVNGLYNAKTFGLYRPGYEFVGWGTSPSGGTIFDEDDGNLKPTDITSDIINGDCEVTLYAAWEKVECAHTIVTDEAVAATCVATGLTEGSHCSTCGEVLKAQEVVPATGHTVVTDKGVAATCTTDGKTDGSHCSKCGEVLTTQETIPALGHNYVNGICSVCGDRNGDYVDENAPQVIVGSANSTKGGKIQIPINLKNNPGIVSMSLKIEYDSSAMKLAEVDDAGVLGQAVHSPGYTSPYSLAWVNDTATANFTTNDTIVTLTFEISDEAEIGKYPIKVSYDFDGYDIYNVDVQRVKFETVNGYANITNVIIGDVNGDGLVNNLDRLILTRCLANWPDYPRSMIIEAAADVNCDGLVNNLDRLILTRYLANWPEYASLPYEG